LKRANSIAKRPTEAFDRISVVENLLNMYAGSEDQEIENILGKVPDSRK
jgi:hypothetical protein